MQMTPWTGSVSKNIRFICWILLFFWLLFSMYANSYEGWGQWAVGRILSIPLLISGIMLVIFAISLFVEYKRTNLFYKLDIVISIIIAAPFILFFFG